MYWTTFARLSPWMLRRLWGPSHWQAPGSVGSEVAQVPAFDELAEGRNSRVLRQCTKGCNAKPAVVLEVDLIQLSRSSISLMLASRYLDKYLVNVKPSITVIIYWLALRFSPPYWSRPTTQHQEGSEGAVVMLIGVLEKDLEQNMRAARFILANEEMCSRYAEPLDLPES